MEQLPNHDYDEEDSERWLSDGGHVLDEDDDTEITDANDPDLSTLTNKFDR